MLWWKRTLYLKLTFMRLNKKDNEIERDNLISLKWNKMKVSKTKTHHKWRPSKKRREESISFKITFKRIRMLTNRFNKRQPNLAKIYSRRTPLETLRNKEDRSQRMRSNEILMLNSTKTKRETRLVNSTKEAS